MPTTSPSALRERFAALTERWRLKAATVATPAAMPPAATSAAWVAVVWASWAELGATSTSSPLTTSISDSAGLHWGQGYPVTPDSSRS